MVTWHLILLLIKTVIYYITLSKTIAMS